MRGKFVSYKSTALLALAAAVGAGVPFKDAMGHEYHPMPGARKREGRAHRDGTFTRTGAVPRRRNAWIQRQRAQERAMDAEFARAVSRPVRVTPWLTGANATHGGAR